MDVKDGQIAADVDRDILKLAVVERYGKNGRVSTALVHGFGLKQGALAASVSHDHHNIVVVGTNDRDMAVCVEKLQELHGGFVSALGLTDFGLIDVLGHQIIDMIVETEA